MPKRKYDPAYVKYGFVSTEHSGVLLQCVVCMKTLCNTAMKPSLLKRHLETNHADKMNRDQSYLQQLGENVKRQRMDKIGQIQQKGAEIVKATYEVAFLVAKQMKAHTIAESLVTPAAKILVRRVTGEHAVAKLECFPLQQNCEAPHRVAVDMRHIFAGTGLIILCSCLHFRVWVWFH